MKNVPIKGIIPPIVTPMSADESVNIPELRNQIERQIAGGVHGIFPFGTNGEGYILSMKEKEEECRKIGTDTDSFGPINSIWAEYGKYLDRKEAKLKDDEERKKNESLSPEEEALLEKVYNALNQDGQGLTVDQLREALQAMGINMSLNDIMAKLQAMGYEVTPGLRLGLPDFKKFLLELKATKNNKEDIQTVMHSLQVS